MNNSAEEDRQTTK